jgi:hypothetical protein
MNSKDFGSVQEPDKELVGAPWVEHNEAAGTLSATANMLRFTGAAGAWDTTGLFAASGPVGFDRALLIARLLTAGTPDYAGLGLLFPNVAIGVQFMNANIDTTDRIQTYDLRSGAITTNLSSDPEFSTTLGLLKMQIDVVTAMDSKNLPTFRFNISYAWDGVLVQTRLYSYQGRGILMPLVIPYVITYGATGRISLDRVTVVLDKKSPSDAEKETLV